MSQVAEPPADQQMEAAAATVGGIGGVAGSTMGGGGPTTVIVRPPRSNWYVRPFVLQKTVKIRVPTLTVSIIAPYNLGPRLQTSNNTLLSYDWSRIPNANMEYYGWYNDWAQQLTADAICFKIKGVSIECVSSQMLVKTPLDSTAYTTTITDPHYLIAEDQDQIFQNENESTTGASGSGGQAFTPNVVSPLFLTNPPNERVTIPQLNEFYIGTSHIGRGGLQDTVPYDIESVRSMYEACHVQVKKSGLTI